MVKDSKEVVTFHSIHDHFIPRRCTLSHLLHDIIHDRVSEMICKQTNNKNVCQVTSNNINNDEHSNNNNTMKTNTKDVSMSEENGKLIQSNNIEAKQENNEKSSQDLQRKLQLLNTYKTLLKK